MPLSLHQASTSTARGSLDAACFSRSSISAAPAVLARTLAIAWSRLGALAALLAGGIGRLEAAIGAVEIIELRRRDPRHRGGEHDGNDQHRRKKHVATTPHAAHHSSIGFARLGAPLVIVLMVG